MRYVRLFAAVVTALPCGVASFVRQYRAIVKRGLRLR
jgi:hypothetical protein